MYYMTREQRLWVELTNKYWEAQWHIDYLETIIKAAEDVLASTPEEDDDLDA